MPLITIHVMEKVFNADQKRQLIENITDAMVAIEGESMRSMTWVMIKEVSEGDWGVGGYCLNASDQQ